MHPPIHRVARRRAWRGWASALLALCVTTPTAWSAPLVVAVSRTPLSLPLYVAEAQGFFAKEGLQPRFTECVGGARCMRLLLDAKADVATISDTPIMFGAFKSRDFVVFATMVTTTDDVKLIARRDSDISRAAHLAGKTVGVVRGSASHYFLDVFLLLHGIDPKAVHVVPLPPEGMREALAAGTVDAVSAWEPFAHEILRTAGDSVVALPNPGLYRETFNLVARRSIAGVRDADLAALLRAVERAQDFIRNEPQQAQAILRARLGVDEDFVRSVWPHLNFRLSLDQALLRTLESEARWALREGHASGEAPNYLPFFHMQPLLQVKPAAATLPR